MSHIFALYTMHDVITFTQARPDWFLLDGTLRFILLLPNS